MFRSESFFNDLLIYIFNYASDQFEQFWHCRSKTRIINLFGLPFLRIGIILSNIHFRGWEGVVSMVLANCHLWHIMRGKTGLNNLNFKYRILLQLFWSCWGLSQLQYNQSSEEKLIIKTTWMPLVGKWLFIINTLLNCSKLTSLKLFSLLSPRPLSINTVQDLLDDLLSNILIWMRFFFLFLSNYPLTPICATAIKFPFALHFSNQFARGARFIMVS